MRSGNYLFWRTTLQSSSRQLPCATRPGLARESGARTRIRTRDQLIKSQLLYQLSYAGAPAILAKPSYGTRQLSNAFCRSPPLPRLACSALLPRL